MGLRGDKIHWYLSISIEVKSARDDLAVKNEGIRWSSGKFDVEEFYDQEENKEGKVH